MDNTYMERHVDALLAPETPEERTLSNLYAELGIISDRYRNDTVMLTAVTSLAQSIIKLAGDGETGRIDPSTLIRKVEDTVERTGARREDL